MGSRALNVDAVVLCGGLGTRLRSAVPDRPKVLAEIHGRPFLDLLLERLVTQGVQRIVLSVGYLQEQIVSRYARRTDASYLFAREDVPLGTGGAVLNALSQVATDPYVVMNGDSLCDVDVPALVARHRSTRARATLVVAPADARHDAGIVRVDASGRITAFDEKPQAGVSGGNWISAGIYIFQRGISELEGRTPPFSLERHVFPALCASGACFAFSVDGPVIDIGTPERYASFSTAVKS